MVNAQNLKYPIKSVGSLIDFSLPGPLDTPNYLQNLPMGLGPIPDPMPKAQGGGVSNDILDALGVKLQEKESAIGGIKGQRDSIADQILAGYQNQPEQSPRKRVPRDTQLLTGGIGLLLRALGASHEATLGGVNTALSGMQQQLDEEVERENTKKFRDYEATMKALGFKYEHLKGRYGEESDEATSLKKQINELQSRVDKDLENRRKLVIDSRGKIDDLAREGKLTPQSLRMLTETGAMFGVDIMTSEEFYDLHYQAEQNLKRMTAEEKRKAEEDALKFKKLGEEVKQSELKTKGDTLKLQSEQLEYDRAVKTGAAETQRVIDNARKAKADADYAEWRAQNAPSEAASQEATRAASRANYYSLIEERQKKSEGGGNVSKEDSDIMKAIDKDVAAYVAADRKLLLADDRKQTGEKLAQDRIRGWAKEDAMEKYLAAPQHIKDKMRPSLVKAGILSNEMVTRPG